MTRSALHEAARAYALAGWKIFCLKADDGGAKIGKMPATLNGFKDATTDLAQIDTWWAENPNYNIGFCPADDNLSVVDLDGADGLAAWEELPADLRPRTWTTTTWSGGRHLFFEGRAPSSVRKIVPGRAIDTRGIGGYVVLPPSRVSGQEYAVYDDCAIEPLPQWISDRLHRSDIKITGGVDDPDEGAALARGRRLLLDRMERGDNPTIGPGANDRTFKFVAQLRDLGLSQGACFDLLMEHCQCPPPWDQALSKVVTNAFEFAGNEEGVYATENSADVFKGAVTAEVARPQPPAAQGRANPFELHDEAYQDTVKDTPWLIPGVIPDSATVLLYGPTGSFKSTLVLDIALSVSSGGVIFGVRPVRTGWVAYATLEGMNTVMSRRRPAWREAHPETKGPIPFYVCRAPRIGHQEQKVLFDAAIRKKADELGGKPPTLIVLDTIAKSMVGMKSDDQGAGQFIDFCDQLRDAYGCPIIAIGHTGKDEERGHAGSQVFANGMDSHIFVKRNKPSRVIEMHVLQHKDEEAREEPYYMEAKLVGRALVLEDIAKPAMHGVRQTEDQQSPEIVGPALRKIGAHSGTLVAAEVLAAEITVVLETDTPATRDELTKTCIRKLKLRAKDTLRAYCVGEGKTLQWGLP